jgi:hypothetical protein
METPQKLPIPETPPREEDRLLTAPIGIVNLVAKRPNQCAAVTG